MGYRMLYAHAYLNLYCKENAGQNPLMNSERRTLWVQVEGLTPKLQPQNSKPKKF